MASKSRNPFKKLLHRDKSPTPPDGGQMPPASQKPSATSSTPSLIPPGSPEPHQSTQSVSKPVVGAGEYATHPVSPNPTGSSDEQTAPALAETLWDTAYDDLKKDSPELIEQYERLLLEQSQKVSGTIPQEGPNVMPADPENRSAQMKKILDSGFQDTSKFAIREKMGTFVDLIDTFKGVIDEAVKVSPEASLAWASVSLVLPLITNISTENEKFHEAFAYVASRASYYAVLEQETLKKTGSALSDGMRVRIRDDFLEVYKAVITFQANAVRHFCRGKFSTVVRDAVQWDDWASLLESIKSTESALEERIKLMGSMISSDKLTELTQRLPKIGEDICRKFEDSLKSFQQVIVPILEDQRDTAHDQLDVERKHLEVSEAQLKIMRDKEARKLSEDERQCRELFRIDEHRPDYKFYKDRVKERVDDTCKWFLEHPLFQSWLQKQAVPLVVTADPGCGKSVLSKYLIDHELPSQQDGHLICYFFFRDEDQQTLRQALCALLLQLFTKDESFVSYAMPFYSTDKRAKERMTSVNVMLEILQKIVIGNQHKPIIFCLDALDECAKEDRIRLIKFINEQFSEKGDHKFKMIITSRPYDHIISAFRPLAIKKDIRIPGETLMARLREEIDVVIAQHVQDLGLSPQLSKYLKEKLTGIDNRTYLWISLVFDSLEDSSGNMSFKRTKKGIDDWLHELPTSVEEYYSKILRQTTNVDFLRTVFCLLLAAKRPLTVHEMNEAVNASEGVEELDLEEIEDFKTTLRRDCGLFVTFHEDIVVFIHQTAREYLLGRTDLEQKPNPGASRGSRRTIEPHSLTMADAHQVVAECCLNFLTMEDIQKKTEMLRERWTENADRVSWNQVYFEGSTTADDDEDEWPDEWNSSDTETRQETPSRRLLTQRFWSKVNSEEPQWDQKSGRLLPDQHIWKYLRRSFKYLLYAARYWHHHILRSENEDMQTDDRTLLLCDPNTASPCLWRIFLLLPNPYENKHFPTENAQLWYFASIGFIQGVQHASQGLTGTALDTMDPDYQESETTQAEILLRTERKEYLTTPLWNATYRGHISVVQELLSRGASPLSKCGHPQDSPLHAACMVNRRDILQLLLDNNAPIDVRNVYGETALHVAAKYADDSYECLKLLLGFPELVSSQDDLGRTPLHHAVDCGLLQAIKPLLNKKADPFAQTIYGETPLHLAIVSNSTVGTIGENILRLLLQQRRPGGDWLSEVPDFKGLLPLHYACRANRADFGRMLMEKKVRLDVTDESGRGPLHYACYFGSKDMVFELLKVHLDVNIHDSSGVTPLLWAILSDEDTEGVKLDIVKMLVSKGASIGKAGDYEENHTQCAAVLYGGNDSIKILRTLDESISEKDIEGYKEKATDEENYWMMKQMSWWQ